MNSRWRENSTSRSPLEYPEGRRRFSKNNASSILNRVKHPFPDTEFLRHHPKTHIIVLLLLCMMVIWHFSTAGGIVLFELRLVNRKEFDQDLPYMSTDDCAKFRRDRPITTQMEHCRRQEKMATQRESTIDEHVQGGGSKKHTTAVFLIAHAQRGR